MVAGITHRDTTLCKLFVGGLPYHTTDETLKEHFDKFGDIEEAVVITDRQTCKSKGYGFVTMFTPEDAQLAIQNPNPVIDGRKANVNLAYLGAKPANNTSPRGGSPNGLLIPAPQMQPLYYFPLNHPLPNMLPPQVQIPLPRQHSPTAEYPPSFPIMHTGPEYFLPYMPHPHPAFVPQHMAFQPHHGLYAPTMFQSIVQ